MRLTGLRPRITLLVAGVVACCLLAGFVAVYRGTVHSLQQTTDHGLSEDVSNLRAAVVAGSTGDLAHRAQAYFAHQPFRPTTHVAFVSVPGHGIVATEPELLDTHAGDLDDTSTERRREAVDAEAVLGAPPGFSRRRLPGVGPVRLLISTMHVGGSVVRLGVAEPLQPIDHARDSVSRAFLLAGLLGMTAALIGGFLVATRLSAPLRRMARVATRVDAGDLKPRMELGGPHDEIRVLAHSFDQMLNRLEDEFARQNAFVADASHELRTPLTIVRGQLEVLAMSESPDPQEMRRVQQIVLAEVDRMSRLVDDLVVLAHADDDRFLHLTQIDVPEFLAGICDSLRPTADRRVELAPIPPLVIECDPDRLAQAMRNLIANAFTHTDPGGLIEVAVEAHEDRVWFVVDDDGPGVSPEDRAHIFDRFTRLDEARGRASGGAGLGLSIVRAIAHAHGGEVRVERSPRGGARFVLDLLTTPPVRRRGGDRTPG